MYKKTMMCNLSLFKSRASPDRLSLQSAQRDTPQQSVFCEQLQQSIKMLKYLIFLALLAFAAAKPLVYTAPVAAAYTAPVAAAYTAPVAYSAYSAYSPVAYSAYTYAAPYTYYV
ncbi:pupal cuticle protein C1B-like [Zerene cesonia]|uniref:pupal cuticle protein C1B-like n=1 Tax=Zerene cesonia TaxID=33412 RepID=UPI0018E598D6|nr:pupal cuticle protein C1B-like [Zerene cesonia]